jgi:hypothetical protein
MYPYASMLILHRRYLGPILDKLRAGECFRTPLQQQADQPSQANAPVDEDVAAEASRVNSHNGNITDILELHRSCWRQCAALTGLIVLPKHAASHPSL